MHVALKGLAIAIVTAVAAAGEPGRGDAVNLDEPTNKSF
jgi:hypothetical protein